MNKRQQKEMMSRIKSIRKKHKYTQQEMADKLDIAHNSYAKMENSFYMPSINILMKLSDILDVSTDYILYGFRPTNKTLGSKEKDILLTALKDWDIEELKHTRDSMQNIIDIILAINKDDE